MQEPGAANAAKTKLSENLKKLQGISLKTTEMQDTARSFSSMAKEVLRFAENDKKWPSLKSFAFIFLFLSAQNEKKYFIVYTTTECVYSSSTLLLLHCLHAVIFFYKITCHLLATSSAKQCCELFLIDEVSI